MRKLKKLVYKVYFDKSNGKIIGNDLPVLIMNWAKNQGIKIPKTATFPLGSAIFVADLDMALPQINGKPDHVVEVEAHVELYERKKR